jgi:hypothetical protein
MCTSYVRAVWMIVNSHHSQIPTVVLLLQFFNGRQTERNGTDHLPHVRGLSHGGTDISSYWAGPTSRCGLWAPRRPSSTRNSTDSTVARPPSCVMGRVATSIVSLSSPLRPTYSAIDQCHTRPVQSLPVVYLLHCSSFFFSLFQRIAIERRVRDSFETTSCLLRRLLVHTTPTHGVRVHGTPVYIYTHTQVMSHSSI